MDNAPDNATTIAVAAAAAPFDGFFLWGAPHCGKSGFAGCLYGLWESEGATTRWATHPRYAADAYTAAELTRAYLDLRDRGYRKTDVRENPRPLDFHIVRRRGDEEDGDPIRLMLVDPAGEYVSEGGWRDSAGGRQIHARAAGSRGVIWLVEPVLDGESARRVRSQAEILPQLVALLAASGGQQIDVPVAICLSMIDKLSSAQRDRVLDDPRAVLREHLGEVVPRWFEALCPRHRFFGISSAGVVTGEVRPINVSAVIEWIVAEDGRRRGVLRPERAGGGMATMLGGIGTALRGIGTLPRPRWTTPVARTVWIAAAATALAGGAWAGRSRLTPRATPGPAAGDVAQSGAARGSPPPRPATAAPTGVAALGRALAEARAHRWSVVVDTLLADSLPQTHPLRRRFDSLFAVGALEAVRGRRGASAAPLATLAHDHATSAIRAGAAGSRALAPMYYVRARSCDLGALGCDRAQEIEDYTWVRVYGSTPQRTEARQALGRLLAGGR